MIVLAAPGEGPALAEARRLGVSAALIKTRPGFDEIATAIQDALPLALHRAAFAPGHQPGRR